jgi:hypothetical protein
MPLPIGEIPIISNAAGAGARRRDRFELIQVLIGDVARRMGSHRLEHVLDRHVLAAEAAGHDRAAVQHERRDIEPRERHHAARDRLVTAREGDQTVEHVTARDELDRVRNHLAAHE